MTTPTIAAHLARTEAPVHKARRQPTDLEDLHARLTEPSAPGSIEHEPATIGEAR